MGFNHPATFEKVVVERLGKFKYSDKKKGKVYFFKVVKIIIIFFLNLAKTYFGPLAVWFSEIPSMSGFCSTVSTLDGRKKYMNHCLPGKRLHINKK